MFHSGSTFLCTRQTDYTNEQIPQVRAVRITAEYFSLV
eukprot:UN20141